MLRLLRAFRDRLLGLRLEIQGQSMQPTLQPGTRLVASRLSFRWGTVRRGDVVVIKPPAHVERLEIKRVLGLPYELISWQGGCIRVDSRPLEEPYARIPDAPPGDDETRTVRLESGEYFVAGDNRLFSQDSRRYGPIPRRSIIGIVTVCAKAAA